MFSYELISRTKIMSRQLFTTGRTTRRTRQTDQLRENKKTDRTVMRHRTDRAAKRDRTNKPARTGI